MLRKAIEEGKGKGELLTILEEHERELVIKENDKITIEKSQLKLSPPHPPAEGIVDVVIA